MNLLFLIGMPGVGKSYWAQKIAHHYQYDCIDLDLEIEKKLQMPIAELFTSYGEEVFRKYEHQILLELLQNVYQHTVIACGGGTPCYNDNMRILKSKGLVLYLKAPINIILSQLQKSEIQRPLLTNTDIEQRLKQLLQERERTYLQADIVIEYKDMQLDTIGKILSRYKLP